MLVLGRKVGESIVVGKGRDAVRFTVLKARGGSTRVGIETRPDIQVVRGEIEGTPFGGLDAAAAAGQAFHQQEEVA